VWKLCSCVPGWTSGLPCAGAGVDCVEVCSDPGLDVALALNWSLNFRNRKGHIHFCRDPLPDFLVRSSEVVLYAHKYASRHAPSVIPNASESSRVVTVLGAIRSQLDSVTLKLSNGSGVPPAWSFLLHGLWLEAANRAKSVLGEAMRTILPTVHQLDANMESYAQG